MRHTSAKIAWMLKVALAMGLLMSVNSLLAVCEAGQVADIERFFKYPVPLTISG